MSATITLNLPDSVLQRAELWAAHTEQPVSDFLSETIQLSLGPLGQAPPPASEWSDEEVLTALELQLSPEDDRRLSDLLGRQREGCLSERDADELRRLMLECSSTKKACCVRRSPCARRYAAVYGTHPNYERVCRRRSSATRDKVQNTVYIQIWQAIMESLKIPKRLGEAVRWASERDGWQAVGSWCGCW